MSKPRGRPFLVGNTMGRGRPKGSRNATKSPAALLLEEYRLPVTRKCIAQALQGDRAALRLCMERMVPAPRESPIRMKLPAIHCVQDVDNAAEKVTQAVTRGKVTPFQGQKVMSILDARAVLIEKANFEKRLEELEKQVADPHKRRAA